MYNLSEIKVVVLGTVNLLFKSLINFHQQLYGGEKEIMAFHLFLTDTRIVLLLIFYK